MWYEAVDHSIRLTQGDLIVDCPIVAWQPDPILLEGSKESEALTTAIRAIRADVVVMTQSCDLENEKVANVILCPHFSLEEYREAWATEMRAQGQNLTEKAWRRHCEDVREGFVWNLAMLNRGESGVLSTSHRIVDFHSIYTVPFTFLESILMQRLQPRLRLLPPYREHLSQAFARYFMRVGLPVAVFKTW
jgi:hypothetical protein